MSNQQLTSFSTTDAIKGIDVSANQLTIDWSRVAAAQIQFCFVRATERQTNPDRLFHSHFGGAKAAGLLTGAYHYLRPDGDVPAQIQAFLKVVPSLSAGDLPPVLDVETNHGVAAKTVLDSIQTWLEAVENALGRQPIIYTYPSFWSETLKGSNRFAAYHLWIAHYTKKASPQIPQGFDDYVFWQFSEQGKVDGISGNVDLDRFNGTTEELRHLAWLD